MGDMNIENKLGFTYISRRIYWMREQFNVALWSANNNDEWIRLHKWHCPFFYENYTLLPLSLLSSHLNYQ